MPSENLAGTLYGTVLVSSVVVTLDSATESAGTMIAAVAVTAVVFALAHAWAVALEHSAEARRPLTVAALRKGLKQEWGIVEAAFPAVGLLVLAILGVLSTNQALTIALIVNTVLLAVWGAALQELAGGTPRQHVTAGLTSAALGVVLILLKVLVH